MVLGMKNRIAVSFKKDGGACAPRLHLRRHLRHLRHLRRHLRRHLNFHL